jgi:quercetin dioxygenase-like cupin family protein
MKKPIRMVGTKVATPRMCQAYVAHAVGSATKGRRWLIVATMVLAVGTPVTHEGRAQSPPTKVHQALQAELSGMPDQETLVQVVDFSAGGGTPWHTHPDGHEIAYILEGIWIAEADGIPTKHLKAGDSVYVPPNVVHRAFNDASGPTKILVVRIKPKGQPVSIVSKR